MVRLDSGYLADEVMDAIPGWQVLAVQHQEAVARSMGVTASDLQCLFVLNRRGPCSPKVIAESIGLTTGSASRMVDRLLTAGLVTRENDLQDRRRVVVTVTPDALEHVQELYQPMNQALRSHLAELPDTTLTHLLSFVRAAEASTYEVLHAAL